MNSRRIRVSDGPGVYKVFIQIPKDSDDVIPLLRVIRDLAPRMNLTRDDRDVMKKMEGTWIDIERAAVASFYDVDPYELARRPRDEEGKP